MPSSKKTSRSSKKAAKQAEISAPAPAPVPAAANPAADAKAGTKRKSDKPVRHRTGTKALREIKKYQMSTDPLTRLGPLSVQVRKIAARYSIENNLDNKKEPTVWRFKPDAIEAIRDAKEAIGVKWFETARDISLHAGKKTIFPDDADVADRVLRFPWWMPQLQKAESAREKAAAAATRRRSSSSSKSQKSSKKSSKKAAAVDAAATAPAAAANADSTQ